MCMYVCSLNFLLKNFPSETIDWIFTKFHGNVPYVEVKNFPSPLEKKSGLCSDTGAQAPLFSFFMTHIL